MRPKAAACQAFRIVSKERLPGSSPVLLRAARLVPPPVGGFVVRSRACLPSSRPSIRAGGLNAADHPNLYAPEGGIEARWERPHLTVGSLQNPAASAGCSHQRLRGTSPRATLSAPRPPAHTGLEIGRAHV